MYDFPSTKEFLIQTEQHKCNLNIVQSSKLKTKINILFTTVELRV